MAVGVAAAVGLAGGTGRAATDNWKDGNGNWATPANWSGGAVPGNDDTVNIGVSNTASFAVIYNYTGTTIPALRST
jgi:hypothetical protein